MQSAFHDGTCLPSTGEKRHNAALLLDGLSGHADYAEITEWLKASALTPQTRIYLVHGEPDAADHQRKYIEEQTPMTVKVAEYMQTITV